jgi:hypothetical protein
MESTRPKKVLRVFFLASHSHLNSFALDFYFFKITQPLTYFFKLVQLLPYFYSSVTVHCKGERRKTLKNTTPPSLGSIHTENLKSETSQELKKPQRTCTFTLNSASEQVIEVAGLVQVSDCIQTGPIWWVRYLCR